MAQKGAKKIVVINDSDGGSEEIGTSQIIKGGVEHGDIAQGVPVEESKVGLFGP